MIDRLLFLDFDGVLNTSRGGYLNACGEPTQHMLRPSRVRRLTELVRHTGAKVVISSTWRELHKLDELRTILHRVGGLPKTAVIGQTPIMLRDTRGNEIAAYLAKHGRPCHLAVLDDQDWHRFDMTAVRPWLVQTDEKDGLTPRKAAEARALLLSGPVYPADRIIQFYPEERVS